MASIVVGYQVVGVQGASKMSIMHTGCLLSSPYLEDLLT